MTNMKKKKSCTCLIPMTGMPTIIKGIKKVVKGERIIYIWLTVITRCNLFDWIYNCFLVIQLFCTPFKVITDDHLTEQFCILLSSSQIRLTTKYSDNVRNFIVFWKFWLGDGINNIQTRVLLWIPETRDNESHNLLVFHLCQQV